MHTVVDRNGLRLSTGYQTHRQLACRALGSPRQTSASSSTSTTTTYTSYYRESDRQESGESGDDDLSLFLAPAQRLSDLDFNFNKTRTSRRVKSKSSCTHQPERCNSHRGRIQVKKRAHETQHDEALKRHRPSPPPSQDGAASTAATALDQTDSEDEERVNILIASPGSTSTVHYPCPFSVRWPEKGYRCAHTSFDDLQDLKSHIWVSHRRNFTCPMCHSIFSTSRECNSHIRERNCSLRSTPELEGVADEDVERLARRPEPGSPEAEQWLYLWDAIFPGVKRPSASEIW